MKITIEPTSRVCEIHVEPNKPAMPGRIWEGVTDQGTPVQLLVVRIAPTIPEPLPDAVGREFANALTDCRAPREVREVFPLRMVL